MDFAEAAAPEGAVVVHGFQRVAGLTQVELGDAIAAILLDDGAVVAAALIEAGKVGCDISREGVAGVHFAAEREEGYSGQEQGEDTGAEQLHGQSFRQAHNSSGASGGEQGGIAAGGSLDFGGMRRRFAGERDAAEAV